MIDDAKKQLTEQRVLVSNIELSLVEQLSNMSAPAPAKLAYRALQQSRMWLGEAILAIGGVSPYKESFNKDSKEIEPQWDKGAITIAADEGEVAFIKAVRKEVQALCKSLAGNLMFLEDKKLYQIAAEEAYVQITKARQWLGICLSNLRDEAPAAEKTVETGGMVLDPAQEIDDPNQGLLPEPGNVNVNPQSNTDAGKFSGPAEGVELQPAPEHVEEVKEFATLDEIPVSKKFEGENAPESKASIAVEPPVKEEKTKPVSKRTGGKK